MRVRVDHGESGSRGGGEATTGGAGSFAATLGDSTDNLGIGCIGVIGDIAGVDRGNVHSDNGDIGVDDGAKDAQPETPMTTGRQQASFTHASRIDSEKGRPNERSRVFGLESIKRIQRRKLGQTYVRTVP
jgi:hypothetical protein